MEVSKINFRTVLPGLKRPSADDVNLPLWLGIGIGLGWLLAWWFAASHIILENDTWWQIVAGQDILAGHWPVYNTWSWSLPHQRWMVQEPLFDVLNAWLGKWGYWGLSLLTVAFMVLCMAFLWDLLRRRSGDFMAILLTSAGLFLTLGAWQARPQIADYLGLVVLLWAIDRHRYWVVPFMTVLWANLHSGAVISPLFMTVFLTAAFVPKRWLDRLGLRADDDRIKLLAPTVGTYLATLATHNGVDIWVYSVHTLFDSPAFARYITEWMPPPFGDPATRLVFVIMLLLILFLLLSRRDLKLSCGEAVLFAGFLFQAIGETRFMPYLYLIIVIMISPLVRWDGSVRAATKAIFLLAVLTTFLLAVADHYGVPSPNLQVQAALEGYPVSAVAYIKHHHLGHVFNNYNWGGYLIYEGVPVYIDGRSEVYYWSKKNIFTTYVNTERLTKVNQGLKGANVVLDYKNSILVKYLLATRKWKVLGSDRWAVLLGRTKR
ncbi:MAG: hypothetical protein M0Z41_16260 [Peptococcaceae bacterium]|nr:hypothetical protein [Peptococcaceae bacterium]